MAANVASSYRGPACPRCNYALDLRQITPGDDICPNCQGFFEARVFHPPQRVTRVVQLAHAGPEGGAMACANHPRNAAVTNCERCGVFICSLCELDISGVRYCPACFDRLSTSGTLDVTQTRFRDYATLAGFCAFVGLVFSALVIGLPLACLALFYVYKGFRVPDIRQGRKPGLIVALLLALTDIGISIMVLAEWVK